MPDPAVQLRLAARDFQPASFAERGAHVPFTSPMLTHARLRVSPHGTRELVIRNPGGGDGWYVGQWHSMIDAARLSVHDRLLYRRLEAVETVQPLLVRRIAREVALEGFAGRAARDAAEAALAEDRRDHAEARVALLARLFRHAGLPGRADAMACAGSGDVTEAVLPGILAELEAALGQSAGVLAEWLERLAAALGAVGLDEPAKGRLGRELASLCTLVGALDRADAEAGNDEPLLALVVQRAAEAAIRLAEGARNAALAGAGRPHELIAAGEAAIARCEQQAIRMAWLLDGWNALAAVWWAAESGSAQQQRRAITEIVMNLPPLPRDMDAPGQPAPAAPSAGLPPRWVRAGEDWLTGVAERDLVARNEMLLARAL